MSKIKHWDEKTQSWVIDGASNAANIELTNPGFLNLDGSSISVDLGFTKLQNRLFQTEKNVAWIYQNGAKGGGGGGGGGGSDSTAYTIEIEEGNRVYTSGISVTIHITINGGSVRKNFNVVIQDENGNTKGTYVITSLTRTEIKINNLTDSTNRLTINANSGQNYASPITLTVIAGAIKLTLTSVPPATIYPLNPVNSTILTAQNSTDSDLNIVVICNGELIDSFDIPRAKESLFIVEKVATYLEANKSTHIGETFTFEIYAVGVLNDNLLRSESITFRCTVVQPNTLYIITYGVNETVPTNNMDLINLNKFIYGNSILFNYQLTYSKVAFSYYDISYTVTPCYFLDGVMVEETARSISGTISKVIKGVNLLFLFNTSSLPDDTIYDTDTNQYKFVKVEMTAVSVDSVAILDTKTLYFCLSEATTKYITATNFNNSLFAYFSPIMGVPVGNITEWLYDNRNTRFPYSSLGVVQLRFINMQGHNLSGFMLLTDMQGMHLLGKSYTDLELPLFSENANEINLLNGNGWTLSFTFRTDNNVDASDVVASLGKYNGNTLLAGIEILASKVIYAVQTALYSANITKGDLVSIDIVGQRYMGPGDTEASPNHWFIKTYINGVLSMITSHTSALMFNTDNSGIYGWYFNEYLHLGGRVIDGEITDACSVHIYDFKGYSTALSDNEIILNYISSTIYSLLGPNNNPDMSILNKMLLNNFILIGTDGNYHNILFDENDETEYKDANSLLNSLIGALAESKIPYPIVVVNQLVGDSRFLGITEAKFNEDLKDTVMASRFAINIDYYTMGNVTPIRIANTVGTGMSISIQGTSSLRYNSKNYEIYMGQDDEGKDVLVLMREDWLPENRYTLKADVMDSSHVNNILVGSIVNGLVTTKDAQGQTVKIVPMDNTPPMERSGYQYANKVKHTSEGYPCILFIKFKATGSDVSNTRCMGIYNFNLGRYAYYNLGLKLINGITYTSTEETYPRMVASYSEELEIEPGSPVYSMEVQENNNIAMFDQDDPDILKSGVFEFPYDSDRQGETALGKLLSFLASFGYNIETDKKVYRLNDWQTPKLKKVGGVWQESGDFYPSYDPVNYVKSTLDLYMNWNNMVSYYMIAIVFGLVDSMAKNLTLRSWTRSSEGSIWYMCFYDMDTALRVNNVGAETVPYNAHLHRYYTDNTALAEARVTNHCPSIPGVFNLVYSGYNTRLQEIVENIRPDSVDAKSLQSVYKDLRTNLFPDPEAFIEKYYVGQINKVGPALYNYDYYLKYLLVEKTYNPNTGLYGDNTYNYSEISYLHGNGSANVKDWFVKRIKFLDGVYGVGTDGYSTLIGITNTPLADSWKENNAIRIENVSPTSISLGLTAESLIRMTIANAERPVSFWIDDNYKYYRVNNVGGPQVVTIYANNYLTSLDNFNLFTWDTIASLRFPLIKSLSLRDLTNIKSDNFLKDASNLESLISFDLHGVTLLDPNSNVVYLPLTIALSLPNLEELDVSNSSFSEVSLSSSSVIRKLNLSGTRIKTLNYSDQAMLEELIIDNCTELETINLKNCPKLKSLTVPGSVKTVFIGNCPGIVTINADYYGSALLISNLQSFTVSACPGLKYISFNNLNNQELEINLVGAPNLENILLSRIISTNITLPSKLNWNTLREINLSGTNIGYLKYDNTTPLITTYLDLLHFENLEYIALSENLAVEGVKCHNTFNKPVKLLNGALQGCASLRFLHGNFLITGSRVFTDCTALTLNTPSIYSNYPVLLYPVPFIDNANACNISFDASLNSTDEMFSGCASLSGSDFIMLMLELHDNITSLNKMFLNCINIDAEIGYDLFRHCPNVTNITSFVENTSIKGGIYSRKSNYLESDTTTYGTFDFLKGLLQASNAFNGSGLLFIDTNVFAPLDGEYIGLMEADYMFAHCYNLESYQLVNRDSLIPNGTLKSKTFFTNLRNLGTFPKGLFEGCTKVNMEIESEEIDGITFDYLFHWPTLITFRTIDSTIYSGINLIGEIHDNIFGGRLKTDGEYSIVNFTVINAPFEHSGSLLKCNLFGMSRMFENVRETLLQAKYVFRGVTFTNSIIPNNIFEGCTVLNSVQGFFSNPGITNGGITYTFPDILLFKDCTALKDVSYLFDGDTNIDIALRGNGFINCLLTNVNGMLRNSGVFGMIPYRFFYMERNGQIQQTILDIDSVFGGCYKLGFTKDRKLDIGTPYIENKEEFITSWGNAIIKVPGTRVDFLLDFTDFEGDDPYYIDGRDWKSIKPSLENSPYYADLYENVFKYDNELALILPDVRDREVGYLNYMFPADYVRYCSPACTLFGAFQGFTYTTYTLVQNDDGTNTILTLGTSGLVGRLPCKLLESLVDNTKFEFTFAGLNFCAFVNFNSYKFNNGSTAAECRGIKFPPDLFKYNVNLISIVGLFTGINIEVGVDINKDLLVNNTALTNISRLFSDATFDSQDYLDAQSGANPQIDFSIFNTCTELQDVSRLFEVSDIRNVTKGLRIIQSDLFDPTGSNNPNNPRITNISGMFHNNALMTGSIPLFDTSKFTRIRTVNGYLEGVSKGNISNANTFISMHDASWVPQAWIDYNG